MPTPSLIEPVRNLKMSYRRRQRMGMDKLIFHEEFNSSGNQNTGVWSLVASTMTSNFTSPFVALNNGQSTTNGANIFFKTYAFIPRYSGYPTHLEFRVKFSRVPQVNNLVEIGVGEGNQGAVLDDGVCFRLSLAGTMQLVCSYQGTELVYTIPAEAFTIVADQIYHLELIITDEAAELYIDGQFLAYVRRPGTTAKLASDSSWPIFISSFNSGTPALGQRTSVALVSASVGDMDQGKPWPHAQARAGATGIQGQTGHAAVTQTANYANSAAPTSATLSNTAAGYTTLGGQWQFAAVAGAETDYALFGWLNPVAGWALTGKTFHVTRIRIAAFNMGAAVATTPTLLQWAAAMGASAVSLATAEGAAAKAPRRITLGSQSFPVGAAIGANQPDIDVAFDVPLVVHPGEYLHIILKMPVGSATASQVVRGMVQVQGYWD